MNKDYCEIAVVLDRSGSMQSIKKDTIGGYNKFLESQRKLSGKCNISLYQFNEQYETVYENVDILKSPDLTDETFVPNGWTALLDAIGFTVDSLGNKLKSMPEKDRPGKVMVIIMTDGEENSSKEFSKDKIFDKIKHQTDKYGWTFVFLGANQDAIATATSYGIRSGSTLTYAATPIGSVNAFGSLSCITSGLRCASIGEMVSFTSADRDLQNEEINKQ